MTAEVAPVSSRPRSPVAAAIASRPYATMLLWGLAIGLVAALILLTITPKAWTMEDLRGVKLRDSMAVLEHGGPLLVGRLSPGGAYYAVDHGDDEGVFVYIPLLSRLFGVANPVSMVRYLYVALLSLTALVYPAIFYRLTRSWLAGLTAPLMFLVCMLSLGFVDVYWIPAWATFLLLPLIFLLARDWSRFGLVALAAITLAASWQSSIRSYSGLGIAIAAAIVLVLRRWRWWRLLPALAMLAVIYISINAFVFSAIRADRDRRIGSSAAKTIDVTSAHALWGTAYEGIGYLPNSFHLRYLDGVPNARVQQEAPGTVPLSNRYEAIIREAFFRFVRDHPLEAARQYGAKALVVIADTTPYLLIVILTLPAMLLLGPHRRIVRRWVLLAIPAAIVGFLSPMLALPRQWYEEDLYGVIGVVGILGLCWALRRIELQIRERGGVRLTPAGPSSSRGEFARCFGSCARSARIVAVALLALVAIAIGGAVVRQEADRWQQQSAGVLMEHLGG